MLATDLARAIGYLTIAVNALSLFILFLLCELIHISIKEKRFLSVLPDRNHYVLYSGILTSTGYLFGFIHSHIIAVNFLLLVIFLTYSVYMLNEWFHLG